MAAQAVHNVELGAKVVVPAVHVAQLVELGFAANVFEPHGVHDAAFGTDEKEPAGQTMQLDDVALRNVPGAQEHVSTLPETDAVKPGLQVQLPAVLPAGEAELSGHFVHVVSSK